MRRPTVLAISAVLVLAACGAPGSPTAIPATPASAGQVPTATTPNPAATTHRPASARVIAATVTFDGSTCTYAGPTVVPVGSAIEWTLVNTPAALQGSTGGGLLVSPVAFGTTWEDVAAWFADRRSQVDAPPFLRNEVQIWSPEDAAAGVPMRTLVEPYPELVLCINEAGDDVQVYPAVLIQVMKG